MPYRSTELADVDGMKNTVEVKKDVKLVDPGLKSVTSYILR